MSDNELFRKVETILPIDGESQPVYLLYTEAGWHAVGPGAVVVETQTNPAQYSWATEQNYDIFRRYEDVMYRILHSKVWIEHKNCSKCCKHYSEVENMRITMAMYTDDYNQRKPDAGYLL